MNASGTTKPEVYLYTDGACAPNPGAGGWAAVLVAPAKNHRRELSGAEPVSTNNRMELTAVLEGLRALKRSAHVHIVTDSKYVKNAFTEGWLDKWQRNNWRTAGKTPVKNEDLWRALLKEIARHTISWEWVKGHADHPENTRCDELAVLARTGLPEGETG